MENKMDYETKFMRAATSVARFVGSLQARYEAAYVCREYKDAKMYARIIVTALEGQDFFDHVMDWEQRAKEMVEHCDAQLNSSEDKLNMDNQTAL